ncbi:hypothetical protein MmiEs2_05010 [Methanimicrococcus stummii]|uniref:Uncharacterized protein n=1 Tax=Methanimicrococcus stummii TaxID=3028294 RepID=A0AA96V9F7_9EURY|nr:hypothetical protein [Methanimicrococcus sp. Es2]WNY28316.1 hypothetical protein MmiEs2_05010 [Methanimicrococcus sp. Es2]
MAGFLLRLTDVKCCSCGENEIVLDANNMRMECKCGEKWKIIPENKNEK